jgi:3-hydroxy-9,10-secoandrosta-1,3,5(10)-triene-9,17-dione monooxygenase reductase component
MTKPMLRPAELRGGQPAGFRSAAARFATGVTVVTTCVDRVPMGMTVNSFTTVSLDPVLLLVCLNEQSRLTAAVRRSGVFAVTVLAADQELCARRFATRGGPTGLARFAGIPTRPDPATGCPLLSEGVAYFGCTVHRDQPAGDHTVLIGQVRSFDSLRPVPQLLFVDSRYAEIGLPD